ncbi:AAA family ATPase [Paenibacillus dendritiformis]|uniref:uridine kinase family protein n=1 Tax=Paenibacillus dendritiformis TaxID=130049 RepID=UPI003655ED8D
MEFVMKKSAFQTIEQLIQAIDIVPRRHATLVIGIDGCGGSGKSTLASQLAAECPNATVVHMDDFYLPSADIVEGSPMEKPVGADFDWQRMRRQVLCPLSQDREGRYQRYDWDSDTLAEWHTVPMGGVVIVEGVYSIRHELAEQYDVTIWVDCPRETRLSRGLARDGEGARDMWVTNWMVAEDIYMAKHLPHQRADLVVHGTENGGTSVPKLKAKPIIDMM